MTFDIIQWDGEKISRPGIYAGIPMDAYHGDLCVGPSLSSSGMRTIFDQSPAHYFAGSYLNPKREEQEASAAFVMGRAAHHLLLGQEHFAKEFIIRPTEYPDAKTGELKAWHGASTYCKEWLKKASDAGLTVISGEMVNHIKGMAASLHEHPMVGAGIMNGLVEHSLVYLDRETGVWVKVRPDTIPTDSGDVSDLKTAADISDDGIQKAIGDHGYQVQGGTIGTAFREVLGMPMTSFSLVFAEKAPPYCVRVKTLKPDDLDLGEQQARAAIRMFARCVDRGEWPGPGGRQSDAEYVEIKPWRRTAIQYRLSQIEAELAIDE